MGEWRPEWFNSISTPYSIAIALYNPETHNFWMIMITGYTLCVRAQKHNKVDEEAQSWKFQRASRAGSTKVVWTSASDERVWSASSSKANWQIFANISGILRPFCMAVRMKWRPWQDLPLLASTTSSKLMEHFYSAESCTLPRCCRSRAYGFDWNQYLRISTLNPCSPWTTSSFHPQPLRAHH